MGVVQVQIMRLAPDTGDVPFPSYQTEGAAGLDIHSAVLQETPLAPGEIVLVPTGFALAIPPGYEVQIRPRSGLALRYGVTLINSPGTIDSDYRGEIKIPLVNHGKEVFHIRRGERIAQMVITEVAKVEFQEVHMLEMTKRGYSGFGHTGC